MRLQRSWFLALVLAVAAAALVAAPPSGGISFGDLLKKAAQSGSKKKPSSRSTAAVRGWDSEAAAEDSERRNYADLEWLEKIEISDTELDKFVREGSLAP